MRLSILLVGPCVLALMLCSCSRTGVTGVAVDSKLKGYILPKSKVLAAIDLDKLKQTEFYKRHESQWAIPQLNEFSEAMGLDPRRDLSSFLLCWNGTDALAMTRGNFDAPKLKARLSSMPHETFNKLTFYGNGTRDIVLLPKGVALIGSRAVVKGTISDNATGGGGVPEDLQLQLARVNSGAQAWFVSSGVISLDRLSLRSEAASALSNISGYINATDFGILLSSGVTLDAHISCISDEGSQRVNDALRGLIGLARLSTKDNQLEQLKIWDSIRVEKQGKEVHVSAALTPELADKLTALLQPLSNRF